MPLVPTSAAASVLSLCSACAPLSNALDPNALDPTALDPAALDPAALGLAEPLVLPFFALDGEAARPGLDVGEPG